MKVILTVLGCILITSNFETVTGGLVLNYFDKVHERTHERVEKTKENFRNFFHLNKNENSTTTETSATTETGVQKPSAETTTANEKISFQEPNSDVNSKSSTQHQNEDTPIVFPTEIPGATATTEKDGRENFSGSCQAGFQRTTDGRCMPTF